MHKLSKNTSLGYLTLLSVALFATGRYLVLLLPELSFLQMSNSISQLFAVISCILWLFGRIWDELLNKNRTDIFKYAASASGLVGLIFGALNLIANAPGLDIWAWVIGIAFALFNLAWTLYASLTVLGHKAAGGSLWIMSIVSSLTLILLAAQIVINIYEGFTQLSPDALFIYIIFLALDSLGLFAPVIYAVYEGISSLRGQLKKQALPRR